MNEKVVVILSGGMDSTTLLYDIMNQGYDAFPVGFDYGQKHKKELICAQQTCDKLGLEYKVLNLDVLNQVAPSALTRNDIDIPDGHYEAESMKLTVVPNRNMVMLSLATAYAISLGATKLFYGAHAGDHHIYADCRTAFVESMKNSISLCDDIKVELLAPYSNIDKSEVLKRGLELNVDYKLTWSCYKGGELACGTCGTCVERLEAFEKNEVEDLIKYKK